jgi:hypothetical protein
VMTGVSLHLGYGCKEGDSEKSYTTVPMVSLCLGGEWVPYIVSPTDGLKCGTSIPKVWSLDQQQQQYLGGLLAVKTVAHTRPIEIEATRSWVTCDNIKI